ncbi:MAG: lytic transglycosylase domain-containing protein [Pseudomonadota bacterium]
MQRAIALACQFAIATAFVTVSGGSFAQTDPAFGGNFTFRKLAPPPAGTTKRITIQINPEDRANARAAPFQPLTEEDLEEDLPPVADVPGPSDQSDWFWSTVSAQMGTPVAGRFTSAVSHVETAPTNLSPRLDDLSSIVAQHGTTILIETLGKNISPALVLAVIAVESGGRITAESEKGAQGLMQLIPETAARFDVTDSNDPAQNIRGGVRYLSWLIDKFEGDVVLALAGYNAGENAVISNDGVPPYAETRAYVPKVLAAWNVAKALCLTPPDLYSDGCVFRTS